MDGIQNMVTNVFPTFGRIFKSKFSELWASLNSKGMGVKGCFAVDMKNSEFQNGAVVGERIGKAFNTFIFNQTSIDYSFKCIGLNRLSNQSNQCWFD
jgi:hypothetical protein